MFNFLINTAIIKGQEAIGINYYLNGDNTTIFYLTFVSKKKDKLYLEKSLTIKNDFDQLKKEIPPNIPVILSIDGKGVLSKKIVRNPELSIIGQVLPNVNENDFVQQMIEGVNDEVFVSLARKDALHNILREFENHGIHPISLNVSPFRVFPIFKIIQDVPKVLISERYHFIYDNKEAKLIEFTKSEKLDVIEDYQIGEQIISSEYLLSYYLAITYFVPDGNELKDEIINTNFNDFFSKKIYKTCLWTSLLFVFFLLLINFLVLNKFSERKRGLEYKVSQNQELLSKLKNLKEELTWKEGFLAQAGAYSNTRLSVYSDQIAKTVPTEILLKRLEIHPLIVKIKNNNEIQLDGSKIEVEGETTNSAILYQWAHDLKDFNWVDDVVVVAYIKDENFNKGSFTFEIKLKKTE
jgi:hypothetical protein